MTYQETSQAFEDRAKELDGFICWKTNGDEDLHQEALIAVWRGLQIDPQATDAFLRTRIRWKVRDVWKRGSSIDTHRETRNEPRYGVLKDTDVEDEIVAQCMRDGRLQLDEQVIDKVDTERFLDTLDSTEKTIVARKLCGHLDKEIGRDLDLSPARLSRIKAALRPKIEDFFRA